MVRPAHLRIALAVAVAAIVAVAIAAIVGIGHERQVAQRPLQPAPRYGSLEQAPPNDMRRVLATVESESLRGTLDRIYAAADYRPLWSGSRSAARRMSALETGLADLPREGVQTTSADAARNAVNTAADDGRMKADLLLTEQVLTIAKGLRTGFADLADWYIPADEVDVTGDVADALRDGRVQKLFRSLAPVHPQYTALVDALARYKTMRDKGGWPVISGEGEIKIDSRDARVTQLRNRLAAEGYLSARTDGNAHELIDAVKAFQERNGLTPDGRVGSATLAALNVTIDERVGQIIANLERWRHMPRDLGQKYIAVNVADQSLAIMDNGAAAWTTRAIVGEPENPTPVIKADITGVIVNPNWEIPPSIVQKEILPKLRQDPDYLADRNIVVTDDSGKTQWTIYGWNDDFADGPPGRLRQLPGAGNSLGALKFQMDNRFNIYLHDTPNRELFADDDRYRSHGCVRVENPSELAGRVLGREAQDIDAEIANGETKTLRVNPPLPAYIMYWTAFADDHGALQFRDDAYGRDQPIVAALGFRAMQKPAQVVSRSEDLAP